MWHACVCVHVGLSCEMHITCTVFTLFHLMNVVVKVLIDKYSMPVILGGHTSGTVSAVHHYSSISTIYVYQPMECCTFSRYWFSLQYMYQ